MHPGTLLLEQRVTRSPPNPQVNRRVRAQDRRVEFNLACRQSKHLYLDQGLECDPMGLALP